MAQFHRERDTSPLNVDQKNIAKNFFFLASTPLSLMRLIDAPVSLEKVTTMAYDLRYILKCGLDSKMFEDMPGIKVGIDVSQDAEAVLVPSVAAQRFYEEIEEFDFPMANLSADPILEVRAAEPNR